MSSPLPSRDEIVKCLADSKKPVHAGAIGKRLRVESESYPLLLSLLEALALEGTIERSGSRRFQAKSGGSLNTKSWSGVLTATARGAGFVASAGRPDVYVPQQSLAGALHGDLVTIQVLGESRKGVEGTVTEVVERRSQRVAGVIRVKRQAAWLEPDDDRMRSPIILHDGYSLGDDGKAGVVRITRFPIVWDENPEGRLFSVLGEVGEAHVEVAKIKVREQIYEEHPPSALEEAENVAITARHLSAEGRKDLREIPFLTIDPADARDHDDAVFAEKTAKGFRIYIAIADVAEYVQPGTALDEEARRRGCTIYLPDRAIPMLPGSLAADLCSLLPERERYCMCVIVDLDVHGAVIGSSVVEGLMRAAAMITYDAAAKALKFTEKPPTSPQAEAFKPTLKVLARVSSVLRKARMSRGALDLNLPEAKVVLDEKTGRPADVCQRAQDPGIKRAYEIVEELMLLANEVVARWMIKRKTPAVYRVHGKPSEEKLMRLVTVAEHVGAKLDVSELDTPKGVGRWLRLLKKHPKGDVLEMLLLRTLQQAVYDVVNIGHFGLASDAYLHFTSPIRRYPDLLVHRNLKRLLRGARPDVSAESMERLREDATRSSARERAAIKVEREVVDLYRALLMRERVGEIFEAQVAAVVGSGIYVSIQQPFVDVLVRFEGLGGDRYEPGPGEISLIGQRSGEEISVGDTVTIEITDVSILRRQTYGRRVVFEVGNDRPKRNSPTGSTRSGKPSERTQRDKSRSSSDDRSASRRKVGPRETAVKRETDGRSTSRRKVGRREMAAKPETAAKGARRSSKPRK